MGSTSWWGWPLLVLSGITLLIPTTQAQQGQPGQGQEWNTADYYKREHSLGRPYQGGWGVVG